jgi:hypothetical protein
VTAAPTGTVGLATGPVGIAGAPVQCPPGLLQGELVVVFLNNQSNAMGITDTGGLTLIGAHVGVSVASRDGRHLFSVPCH